MATLCGVLNVGNREIIGLCLDRLNSQISDDLKWWQIVQIPRIIVEMTNTNVFPIEVLDSFLLETCQKMIGRSENVELVAMSVLLALPWLSTDNLGALKNLSESMRLIEVLVGDSERFTQVSKSFDVKVSGLEGFEGDAFKALFESVKGLKGPFRGGLRKEPYKTFEGALSSSKPHEGFSITWTKEIIESVHVSEFKPLSIFSDTFDVECCDCFSQIYCQFMFHMLIEAYELNHRRAAEVLFSCVPETCSESISTEKALCQVLFGKLLRSRVQTSVTYYEVLLIDSCRLSRMFPPMMARSLMKMVNGIDEKEGDLEVLERLAGWFAHHLSHYDFKWNWTEWKEITEEGTGETNCKRIFLRLLIFKLLLLSYQEKMQAVLPDFMLKMMSSTSSAPKPSSTFNDSLLEFMKKRPSVEDAREHVAREGIPLQELFEVFLSMGSKTFSHLSNVTDRYAGLFRSASIEDQRGFIKCVSEFWQDNFQNFHLVLEKLVQNEVLQLSVLIEWQFESVFNLIETSNSSDSSNFEVNVLLKLLSSDFLFALISSVPERLEKVNFARSLIDRLASIESENYWLNWLISGLVRKLLRCFFADKSEASIQKLETLISMKENSSNYPSNLKEMVEGTYKSLTL